MEPRRSPFVAHWLTVDDDSLYCERNYPDDRPTAPGIQVCQVLAALLEHRDWAVIDWFVTSGGDGYRTTTVAEGDGDDLIRFIAVPHP